MCFMNLDSRRSRFTLATFVHFNILKNFLSCFSLARFKSESGCKDKTFFVTFKSFSKFFKLFKSLVIRYFELLKQRRIVLFLFNISRTLQETTFLASFMLAPFLVLRVKIRQTFPLLQIFSQLFSIIFINTRQKHDWQNVRRGTFQDNTIEIR